MDFSRYLKEKIRNEKLIHEFWNLFIPIFLTIALTNILEKMMEPLSVDLQGMSAMWIFLLYIIIYISMVGLIVWIVMKLFQPLMDTDTDENFFSDYKEIIDDIIRKKQKQEKKKRKK